MYDYVDPLSSFSVWWFGGVAVVYSLLCMAMQARNGQWVFSKRNAKPKAEIVTMHLKFLAALLVLMWLAPFAYPHLPEWMKDTFSWRGARQSWVDFISVVALVVFGTVESVMTYVER